MKTIMLIAMLLITTHANASNITLTENKAILACIGEAEGENQIGKVAIMEALRNRGTLKGVFGYNAIVLNNGSYLRKTNRGLRKISNITVNNCKSAWRDSATSNYTKGADHWEAVQRFGKPLWARNMKQTFKIGNHTFFKSN